jgi:PAS domain S-box-containing protein
LESGRRSDRWYYAMQNPDHLSDTNAPRLPREEELLRVLEELYGGFAEAEETLSAIRRGEVDGFLVSTAEGEKVYTLKTAEHPYRVLIEQMREGAAILSAEGTVLYSNASFARLLDRPLEKVMGESIHSFIVPAGAATFRRMLDAGDPSGSAGESALQANGKGLVTVFLSLKPLQMDGIRVFSLVATDLTERKQAEETLQRAYNDLEANKVKLDTQNEELRRAYAALETSEEKYRDLYEFAPLGYFTLDARGEIREANLAGASLLGRERGQLIGARFEFFLEPEHILPFNEFLVRAGNSDTKEACDIRIKQHKGKPVWVLLEAKSAAGGDAPLLRVAATDISRQVGEADRALRESEEREQRRAAELQALMEAVPAAIFIALDPESRSIYGSSYTYDLFRLPPGSNLSKSAPEGERPAHFRVLKDGVEIPPEELPIQKVAATGRRVEQSEFDLAFDDGTVRRLLGNAVPLLDENGRPHGAVGAFIDITKRKQAEEALVRRTDDLIRNSEEVVAARDEANLYLDLMTHDVRNANNVSSMYADLLVDLAQGDLKTYAEKLHDSIERSSEILKNVATIRRAHEESSRLVPVNLDAVIRDEIGNFPRASIRYEDLQVEVLADNLLPMVLTNLIGNAVKFGGPGVEVTIRVEERDGEVLVTVADTGPGVPDNGKEAIFHRFERGHAKGRGEGLGLFIVRKLIERYEGRIWVEDRVSGHPEEGAAFKFTLRQARHHR